MRKTYSYINCKKRDHRRLFDQRRNLKRVVSWTTQAAGNNTDTGSPDASIDREKCLSPIVLSTIQGVLPIQLLFRKCWTKIIPIYIEYCEKCRNSTSEQKKDRPTK